LIRISLFIGKRPYAAFGNTAGDVRMLEWTQAGNGRFRIRETLTLWGKREPPVNGIDLEHPR